MTSSMTNSDVGLPARRARLGLFLMLWLPVAVAATIAIGTGYVIAQQVLRQNGNDPQVELAQTAAAQLNQGATPAQVATGPAVDLRTSLAVNVTVLDSGGTVLASTARLDNAVPHPPLGALTEAGRTGQNVVTWQPSPASGRPR